MRDGWMEFGESLGILVFGVFIVLGVVFIVNEV